MNEYELATLSIREWGLWAAFGQIAATVAIGLGQIAIVWLGIRVMREAAERRAKEQDQRHTEAMDRQRDQHTEMMTALDAQRIALETLIQRTAPRGAS